MSRARAGLRRITKYYSRKMGGIVLNTKKGGYRVKVTKKGGVVINSSKKKSISTPPVKIECISVAAESSCPVPAPIASSTLASFNFPLSY